jgi:hypothetical protein
METNAELKKQAELLLEVYDLLRHGTSITGSFVLDLMVCPDLDLYIPAEQLGGIFDLAIPLYRNHLTNEVYIQKGSALGILDGEHIQVRTSLRSERTKWKIDIWVFPHDTIADKLKEMRRLQELLTDEARSAICELKRAFLQPNGFTPKHSGLHICQAYLDNEKRSLPEMKEYLRHQGIDIV